MIMFKSLGNMLRNITALAKIAPELALYVIVALFFSYGLHELLAAGQQSNNVFVTFTQVALAQITIFAALIIITYHHKHS